MTNLNTEITEITERQNKFSVVFVFYVLDLVPE